MRSFLTSILFTASLVVAVMTIANAQTPHILSAEAYINYVKLYHPLAKQAGLRVERADAGLLAARGAFDPVVTWDRNDKVFDGTPYYRYEDGELKIPTITGVTLKAGYDKANGNSINPELTRGAAGYVGVEMPLLKDLVVNKQRATLQQAKIFLQQSEQERRKQVNDLLLDAQMAYWQWAASWQLANTYGNYAVLAAKRLSLVKTGFTAGDRSVADTIEAFSQYQYYEALRKEAGIALNNSTYELSVYLWDEKEQPYFLPADYIPDAVAFGNAYPLPSLDSLETTISNTHPELLSYRSKQEILSIDQKLKWQEMLPAVTLKANLLSKDYFQKLSVSTPYIENNYKLGVSIKTPLFLRQSRGAYREAKLKLKENTLLQQNKAWELQNKLRRYHQEASLYQEQIRTIQTMRQSYQSLFSLEQMKFSQGESSLFLLNSRENKVLETDQKLVELQMKLLKAVTQVKWVAALL